MISRVSVIAALMLLTGAATAAPLGTHPAAPADIAATPVETVRLVCDQNCQCWHTAYREPRPSRADAVLLADDVNACPAGGRYNGHYRSGPGTGLGFESRVPKGTLFPFY